MTTLSDYNNNPGNLRPPKGVTYEGQIGVDEKGFAVFKNKDYGQKALINDVTHKIDRGVDTPDKFVNTFAPAGAENDEDARDNYKIYLAQQLGLKSTSDPFPKDAADRLAKAVSSFEGGTWGQPSTETKKPPSAEPEARADETVTPVKEYKPSKLEESLVLGTAGAIAGGGTGALKEPIVGAWNWATGRPASAQAPVPETSSPWPGTQTVKPQVLAQAGAPVTEIPITGESQPYKQVTATGETEGMTGRERQAGYTEKTGQIAARRKTQEQIAKELGLDVNRPLAGYGDIASTRSGVVVTQKSLEEQQAHERKLIEEAQRKAKEAKQTKTTSSVSAAKKAGEQWAQVQAALKSDDPAVFAWGQKMLKSMRATLSEPWYKLGARLGFGAGAALPYAIDLAREGNTKAAVAVPAATGALSMFAPRVMPSAMAFGAGIADTAQRAREGRTGEALASGLSTGAATAAPFVGAGLNIMGLPATAGIPLYLAASDRLRYLQEHPEEYRVEESRFDPLGNPIR